MLNSFLASETVQNALEILKTQFPLAIWETVYVTILSTFFAILIGLPLGVLLVAGEDGKILRVPRWLLHVLNVIINLLRSVPFLILMIMVFPLTRLIVGTVVGTPATIVPLVIAAFPFIARLVEGSLREINPNIIETAQSMGASPLQIIVKVLIPETEVWYPGQERPPYVLRNMSGAEIDYTILDFVADCRAPTPSAAAELAVPDRAEQERILLDLQQNIRKNMQKRFDLCYNGLEQYNFVLEQGLARRNWQKSQGQLQQVQDAIRQQMQKRLHSAELQLGHAAALTGSLDPYKVLARGYTMVTAANGTILNADDLQPEKTIYVRSASRRAKCRVEAVEEINENTQKF